MVMRIEFAVNEAAAIQTDCSAYFSSDHAFDDMAVLTISNDGVICQCNEAAGKLLDCIPSRIVWQNISAILPQLKNVQLIQEEIINPNLRFLSRIGHHFEVISVGGVRFYGKLYFNHTQDFGGHCLRLIIKPVNLAV
ncbi:MAG: hypothetical protein Q8R23_03160 [Methylotenera sp.]|jgi:hypothetical protein|nr:hypothetical protein [Methylotenera sp.]